VIVGDVIRFAPISLGYYSPDAYLARIRGRAPYPLAAIIHGDFKPPNRSWPQIHSGLRSLGEAACVEVFFTAQRPSYSQECGFQVSSTGEVLFVSCIGAERGNRPLSHFSEEIYSRLLQAVDSCGFPHLLRVWNLMQGINAKQGELERYRQFCVGRHEAFAKFHLPLEERYPSASAVGSLEEGLRVYCLAARDPGLTIENPKQVSAYRYPPMYGPKSPSFSRALVKKWGNSSCLFLSGTASITGHETRHVGRLAAQTEEALSNLTTLVRAAARTSGEDFNLAPRTTTLKAFIRRPSDYPVVRGLLERHLGPRVHVLYLMADLCRSELLFEIEGVVVIPKP
jgi:chorismate lyase / 3-hydroxybenzoate synthase